MKQNYTILHIIDHIGLGGAQTIVKTICEDKNQKFIHFGYSLRSTNNDYKIDSKNFFRYNSQSKFSIIPIFRLVSIIRNKKIDILHCHLLRSLFIGIIIKLFFIPKITLIYHEHGAILKESIYYNFLIRLSKQFVYRYIAVSNALEERLIFNAGLMKSKITVLHNFVDLNKFDRKQLRLDKDKLKKSYNLNKNDFIIGYAGRIIQRKGWKVFLEAAKIVKTKISRSNIRFIIAGTGQDENELLQYIRTNSLTEYVTFLGYQKNMINFYSILDLFIIPSHWEGHPMSQLEALAMELPVVSSNGIGLDEVIIHGENGLYFNNNDSLDLANKIIYLLSNNRVYNEITNNARNSILKYNKELYLKNLSQIYLN